MGFQTENSPNRPDSAPQAKLDLHLHTIASGHGSRATVTDMVKAASRKHLELIGLSDHGPATLCSARASYFRSLAHLSRKRRGVRLLYGAELNILDTNGRVDLPDDILSGLDYAIASLHTQNFKPGDSARHTDAYIHAMTRPNVRIIGHCDDARYPADLFRLFQEAMDKHVILEINEASFAPGNYRGENRAAALTILNLSVHFGYPVLFGSDSHGPSHMGDFTCCRQLARLADVPPDLILNDNVSRFEKWLRR